MLGSQSVVAYIMDFGIPEEYLIGGKIGQVSTRFLLGMCCRDEDEYHWIMKKKEVAENNLNLFECM